MKTKVPFKVCGTTGWHGCVHVRRSNVPSTNWLTNVNNNNKCDAIKQNASEVEKNQTLFLAFAIGVLCKL